MCTARVDSYLRFKKSVRLGAALLVGAVTAKALAHPSHDPNGDEAPTRLVGLGSLPDPKVSIELRDGYRTITANGIPNHPIGQFPGQYNPNAVSAQHYEFRISEKPTPAAEGARPPRAEGHQLFGVALNGIPFDPGTAEFWHDDRASGWRMEAIGGPRNLGLDASNGHVQPNGAYHYHGIPLGLMTMTARERNPKKMLLVGWAADGYPIYGPYAYDKADDAASPPRQMKTSYRLKKADRAGGDDGPGGKPDGSYTRDWEYVAGRGDLDENNGRTGVTPEFPNGTYYYVITGEFPFIPRQFHGTPDPSFTKREAPGGPRRGRVRGGPGSAGGPPPPR
jgi:hypothetical protein